MATTVLDFQRQRLRELGVRRLHGYPGDGIAVSGAAAAGLAFRRGVARGNGAATRAGART